jgi:hypothetical protein
VVGGRYAETPLRAIADSSRIGAYLQGKSIRRWQRRISPPLSAGVWAMRSILPTQSVLT